MIQPAPGVLLIADPFLKDPNFLRTVVFLCEHKEEGSFGFVLNRSYRSTLNELLPEMEEHQLPVYYGGPVQKDSLHFLHQLPHEIPGSIEVMKGVFWGGDFDAVIQLVHTDKLDNNRIRFFVGYSGWGSGQLKTEMDDKTWITAKATRQLVFHPDEKETWKDALKLLGGEYEMMKNFPLDPQLN